MPTKKNSGAAISEISVIDVESITGSKPYSARVRTLRPNAKTTPRTRAQPPRSRPGWRRRATVIGGSSSVRRLLQVLHQRRDLRGGQRLLVVTRHHAVREPLLDLRARIL